MKTPSFVTVIPANVRYDRRLKAGEKILYSEITALTDSKGRCSVTNAYFANVYSLSSTTVSRWVYDLAKFGYIKIFRTDRQQRVIVPTTAKERTSFL